LQRFAVEVRQAVLFQENVGIELVLDGFEAVIGDDEEGDAIEKPGVFEFVEDELNPEIDIVETSSKATGD
jgi:hypothetical protein